MSPSFSPDAEVFAVAHVSEELTVNQCWDVSSDVHFVFSASSAVKRNWIFFLIVLEQVRWKIKYATINNIVFFCQEYLSFF